MAQRERIGRDILALAVPAFGSLVAEPLFLIVDSALVGHLGLTPLAGLGIASSILQTIVGLMVFLAYATTPAVARRFGAGDLRGALSAGMDGLWLAAGVGLVLAVAGAFCSPFLVGLFGPPPEVGAEAETYLSISMAGIPAMLLIFAATGLLRGLQDTITPLWIAGLGFTANAGLNALFIYGLGWGIAGSAIGTVVAQWGMALVYLVLVVPRARAHGARLQPVRAGIRHSAFSGGWLLLRTLALRAALLLTVAAVTSLGPEELAGWQIVFTLFSTTAFALDSLAIAAQALIGKELGGGRPERVVMVLRRTVLWGAVFGAVVGVGVLLLSGILGQLFTGDAEISALIQPALVVLAVTQPIAAIVFVLDGVLIGAGDVRYLALAGVLNLVPTIPALLLVTALRPPGAEGLVWVALCFFGVFMIARLLTLGIRVLRGRWISPAA